MRYSLGAMLPRTFRRKRLWSDMRTPSLYAKYIVSRSSQGLIRYSLSTMVGRAGYKSVCLIGVLIHEISLSSPLVIS